MERSFEKNHVCLEAFSLLSSLDFKAVASALETYGIKGEYHTACYVAIKLMASSPSTHAAAAPSSSSAAVSSSSSSSQSSATVTFDELCHLEGFNEFCLLMTGEDVKVSREFCFRVRD